ncbi:MAG: hypothetical protein GY913_14025 [Proteobacteria bacterium]|nr:hypothetical protein [Pseudomonadota bacterium]
MTTALVLQGGGARGAYEAGVLRFITNEIVPRLDKPMEIPLVSGTSVGALNGAFIAGHGLHPTTGRRLSRIWRNLEVGDVWEFDGLDLLRSPSRLWAPDPDIGSAFLDARPIQKLVRKLFPAKGMRRAFESGTLKAFVVAATEVATGRASLFVEAAPGFEHEMPYPQVTVRPVRMTSEHILASSAIPFLFPPISIDGQPFVDGGLRQPTPLSPMLRMGADRALVVGVKRPFAIRSQKALSQPHENPNLVFLLGKVLNVLMLDPLEQDLSRLERLNAIFDWGTETYGEDFLARLNTVVAPSRGAGYRRVETQLVLPREDLGRVAAQCYLTSEPRLSRATRFLLDTISDREGHEADLLSYLFFDRCYTSTLERLGWEDARAQEQELAAFLG